MPQERPTGRCMYCNRQVTFSEVFSSAVDEHGTTTSLGEQWWSVDRVDMTPEIWCPYGNYNQHLPWPVMPELTPDNVRSWLDA